jgi:hypothetical protein
MKKIILSTVAITTLALTSAYADTSSDIAEMKAMMKQMSQRLAKLEAENRILKAHQIHDAKTTHHKTMKLTPKQSTKIAKLEKKVEVLEQKYTKATPVFAKTSKIKFSGQHYLGFVSKKANGTSATNNFEMRRNYVQVKAYLFDDPKSYMRFTLDETTGNGDNRLRIKYAYLYLNNVLPYTGVEFGQVHRPWLDYEEHQGWWHRGISKTFTESKQSADLTNSADMGVNFKTKTPYFTSEIGLFNGEGYHTADNGAGLSAEWRLTAALLGNGDKKRHAHKTTYWDASFWGQYNTKNATNNSKTYKIYGLHTVYNTPSFLISAQYNVAKNTNNSIVNPLSNRMHHNGKGYSVNADYRFGEEYQYTLFARYDHWTAKDPALTRTDAIMEHYLYGIAWEQNKNVTWYLNGKNYNPKNGVNYLGNTTPKSNSVMLTAEVNW